MSRRQMLVAAVAATSVCMVPLGAQAQGRRLAQQPTMVTPVTDDTPFWDGATMDAARCNAGFFLLYPTLASPGNGPCNNQYATLDFMSPVVAQPRARWTGLTAQSDVDAMSRAPAASRQNADVNGEAGDVGAFNSARGSVDALGRRALVGYVPWPFSRSATAPAPVEMPPLLSSDAPVGPDGVFSSGATPAVQTGDAEFNALVSEMQIVPEPATWSLTLLGLGAMLLAARRRNNAT